MARQLGFFDLSDQYDRLSASGDPLEELAQIIEFEPFRYRLNKALKRSDGSKGGRPAYDVIVMFKVLVLQALYSFSDEQAEFFIRDRLSFMRFLGIQPGDAMPDATTIWLFREHLTRAKALDKLFNRFNRLLEDKGYLAMGGQILDASLIPAPRQHLDDTEKQAIKEGQTANDIWPDAPNKAAQKDVEARWTVKTSKPKTPGQTALAIPLFGYKTHIGIDRKHRLIRTYDVTSAAAGEGRLLRRGLVTRNNTSSKVWADSAYKSKANEEWMEKHGFVSQVHRRKPKGKAMPKHIAKGNATRSKIRACVEHVFAEQKSRMGLCIRTIGLERAKTKIVLANLAYNMKRLTWLERQNHTRIAPT